MAEKEEKKEVKEKYSIGEVVTGTAPAIIVEGNAISEQEAIVLILNKLERIEKSVA
jgi:hypothetical protein